MQRLRRGWPLSYKHWPARGCTPKRKETVEPVFGQIKEARGLRRFRFRGLGSVQAEWSLICATPQPLEAVPEWVEPAGSISKAVMESREHLTRGYRGTPEGGP